MQVEEKLMVSEVNKLRRQRYLKKKQAEKTDPESTPPVAIEKTPLQIDEKPPDNDTQEIELIRLLLHHADREMQFEVENEDKRVEVVQVKVIDFIVNDILADKLTFDNDTCQKMFNMFSDAWNDKQIPPLKMFTEHAAQEVQSLAVDLLSSKYALSKNWEQRHKIYVAIEEDNIKPAVLHAVYAFKLKKLEVMIREAQEAIRDAAANENAGEGELKGFMEAYKDLSDKRQRFAAALNRVVTK